MADPWREALQSASYRGVPFVVTSAEYDDGRRTVTHVFPGRDTPYIQDLGRRPRVFEIEAFVIGPSYHTQRDSLSAALAAEGPGQLQHPYLGQLVCSVNGFRVRDSHDHGGMARFQITFAESGRRLEIKKTGGHSGAVDQAGAELEATAGATLEGSLETVGVPEQVRQAAVEEAERTGDQILDLGAIYEKGQQAAIVAQRANRLILEAQTLITTPAFFVTSINDAVVSVLDALESAPEGALAAYRALEDLRPFSRGGEASTANGKRTVDYTRRLAISGAAKAAARMNFASLDEALEVREDLFDRLDAQLEDEDTGDNDGRALEDLRLAVAEAVPPTGEDLPRLTTFTPAIARPLVTIAYQLYGDADREEEIALRNQVRNPAITQGGVPLQVLDA